VDARASSALQEGGHFGGGGQTITTAYLPLEANYSTHMPNEKPRPLGGTGASELALMDRPEWGWAGSDLSDCRFQRALKPIVPLAAGSSSRGAASAPSMHEEKSDTITVVVN
jgi:hypothetical protein